MKIQTLARRLITHLSEKNFKFIYVNDGEEVTKPATLKDAMELVANLDECHLIFTHREIKGGRHYVSLVNDFDQEAEDMISDWSFNAEDNDGFNVAMDEFMNENFK